MCTCWGTKGEQKVFVLHLYSWSPWGWWERRLAIRRVGTFRQSGCADTVRLASAGCLCWCAFRAVPSRLPCVLCIINAVTRALICMLWKRPDWHRLISTQPCLFSDVTPGCSEWCWIEQAQLEDSRLSGTRKNTPLVSFKLRGFVYVFLSSSYGVSQILDSLQN